MRERESREGEKKKKLKVLIFQGVDAWNSDGEDARRKS